MSSSSTTTDGQTVLPPCNRHITTHDPSGKSVHVKTAPALYYKGFKARSYATTNVPVELANDADLTAFCQPSNKTQRGSVSGYQRGEIVIPPNDDSSSGQQGQGDGEGKGGWKYNGANLMVLDIPPGTVTPMHRTVSVDFVVCTIGVIEHELDSGEKVTLFPGDHLIQRGTNHRWINPSATQPARCIAVTLPCEPFQIGGKMLAEEWAQPEQVPAQESEGKPKI